MATDLVVALKLLCHRPHRDIAPWLGRGSFHQPLRLQYEQRPRVAFPEGEFNVLTRVKRFYPAIIQVMTGLAGIGPKPIVGLLAYTLTNADAICVCVDHSFRASQTYEGYANLAFFALGALGDLAHPMMFGSQTPRLDP